MSEREVQEPKCRKEPLMTEFAYRKLIFGFGLLLTIIILHWWFTFLMSIPYRGILSTIVFFIILGVVIRLAPVTYQGIFNKK